MWYVRWAQIRTDLGSFIDEYIVRFVTGNVGLDTDWDGLVRQVNSLGMPRLVEITQAAYDAR